MKILVVDDEAPIRDICDQTLTRAGYEVRTVSSGAEALPLLNKGWDIVLTDFAMPGAVDGNELVRRVRTLGSADVILMTAYPTLDTAIQALKDGAFDYLIKPFSLDALLMAVKRCVTKRELSQELAREKQLREELHQAYARLEQMEQVREAFGQFVTPEVAKFVLADPRDFWKRGERQVVTVLFADVRSFTSFAACAEPEEVVSALNEIFALVIEAVQHEGGILNKFIGDGLMALFGAPVPNGDHALAAARAALKARDAIEVWAVSRYKLQREPLRVGIGLNTGEVVAGCVGTKERAEYSVIGNTVNMAARLEELAAQGQILVGPETGKLLRGTFELSGTITLKLAGFPQPVPVTELIGEKRSG
jgi:class 3 adenylate cyclase